MRLILSVVTVCLVFVVVCVDPNRQNEYQDGDDDPNFVILYIDDLGYGDLGIYGHPTIETPNIDNLARQGIRFTTWYSGAPVCTPSRTALLTGRLPVRSGMAGPNWLGGVLACDAVGGLPLEEITLPDALKKKGYSTAAIGKWHLGQRPLYLPTQRGFDEYFGIPYSNDMGGSAWSPQSDCVPLPLMNGTQVVEQPVDLKTLTERYTAAAISFLQRKKNNKFFLYLPYNHVHVPQFCNPNVSCGKSIRGPFGDSIAEVDQSVGQIIDTINALGLAPHTLVFLVSDNGPWLIEKLNGGSAGLLRGGKLTTWEGGIRVPAMAWWSGKIKPGTTYRQPLSTMDIYTTLHALAGISLPTDRIIDGKDISSVLLQGSDTPHVGDFIYHYRGTPNPNNTNEPGLWAVSWIQDKFHHWKVHFVTKCGYCSDPAVFHNPPLVFNLYIDPEENFPIEGQQHVIEAVQTAVKIHQQNLVQQPNQDIENDYKQSVCCDWDSQRKYPQYPQCTCNPENWNG